MKEADIRPDALHAEFIALMRREAKERFKDVHRAPVDCPACTRKDNPVAFEKFGFAYCECRDCRTLYVNPLPTAESLRGFYAESETVRFFAEKLYEKTKEARREFIFRPRAQLIREQVRRLGLKDCVVVDIGGGAGMLAEELKPLGVECRVVEPARPLAELCRAKGIPTYESFFEDCDLSDLAGRDFILTCFEMVEHLGDAAAFFRAALRRLRPGGYLMFTTLSGTGFDLRLLWEGANAILPPEHLAFFNPASIAILLKRVGLEVVEVATPGRLDWDIVEKRIKSGQAQVDRFWRIFAEQGTPQAKAELQDWLARNQLSSHMRVWARKPCVS